MQRGMRLAITVMGLARLMQDVLFGVNPWLIDILSLRYGHEYGDSSAPSSRVRPHPQYWKYFLISAGSRVTASTTISKTRAFCGLRLSDRMQPARTSERPDPGEAYSGI